MRSIERKQNNWFALLYFESTYAKTHYTIYSRSLLGDFPFQLCIVASRMPKSMWVHKWYEILSCHTIKPTKKAHKNKAKVLRRPLALSILNLVQKFHWVESSRKYIFHFHAFAVQCNRATYVRDVVLHEIIGHR